MRLLLHKASTRLHIPLALMVLVLQRAPQLYTGLLARISLPSIQIVQKALFTAATLGTTHALSGATVSEYKVNNKTYRIGRQLTLHRETGQEGDLVQIGISNTITPQSWKVSGELPPGLRMTDFLQQADLSNGIFNASAPYLLGTYTTAGDYVVTMSPWSELDGNGDSAPEELTITFSIEEGTPPPTDPPVLRFERSATHITLLWNTGEAAGYQLTKSSDLTNWDPVSHPSNSSNGETSVQITPTIGQNEYYRMEPTQ